MKTESAQILRYIHLEILQSTKISLNENRSNSNQASAHKIQKQLQEEDYIAPSEATQQGCGVLPPRAITGGPTIGIDVSQYLVTKVRATQCHASQNPPFSGDPKTEAEHLACHEYFVLAFPVLESVTTHDLFEQKLEMEVHHERA